METRCYGLPLFLFGCSFVCNQAGAETLPTVSITSGAGDAVYASTTNIDLSGPDYTLVFSTQQFPSNLLLKVGQTVPTAFSFLPVFSDPARSPGQPSGTPDVGGTSYDVVYDFIIDVAPLVGATVPSGTATLTLPAALTGGGVACVKGISEFPPFFIQCQEPVTEVANVNIDISGVLTLSFTPFAPSLGIQQFSGIFTPTPVPEPSTLESVLAGLALIFILLRAAYRPSVTKNK